jgi:hypothetical protein
MWRFLILLFPILLLGCGQGPRPVFLDITFNNESPNLVDWARVAWEGPNVIGGQMPPGVSKTTEKVRWPDQTAAIIHFVDLEAKKRFAIEVSFAEIAEQVQARRCKEVIFVIEDYDRASVRWR